MDLHIALIIYFLTLFALFFILTTNRYREFSAFIISVVFSQIVLNVIYPPTNDALDDIDSGTSIYFLVQVGGLVLFIVYAITMAIYDRYPKKS